MATVRSTPQAKADRLEIVGAVAGLTGLGFLVGANAGRGQLSHLAPYEPMIKAREERFRQLVHQNITKPVPAFRQIPIVRRTMHEAVEGYLSGLPNAAVYSVGRSVELALAARFEALEGKARPGRFEDLVNWFGTKHPR